MEYQEIIFTTNLNTYAHTTAVNAIEMARVSQV